MKKTIVKIIGNILFLALFALLLWKFASPQQAIETVKRIPNLYLISGLACLITSYVLRAHRFYQLLAGHNIGWLAILKIMLQHNAINNLVPLRLGELSFPILLKQRHNLPYQSSAKVLITARLFDLSIMGTIALVIISLIIAQYSTTLFVIELIVISVSLCSLWLIAQSDRLPFKEPMADYLRYCKYHLQDAGISSLGIWLAKVAGQALWLSPMLQAPWLYSVFAILIVEGTAILPINGPLNFGSLEGATMAALTPLGLAPGLVLSAILNLHIAIIMLAALGYLVSLLLPSPKPNEVSS